MTNKQAALKLSLHLFQCGMLMPIKWLEANGKDSDTAEAFRLATAALHAQDVPNPPLTLEELREHIRNGHPNEIAPLYVVFFPTMPIEYASRWRDAYNLSQLITSPCPTYGKTWLAYRRKPEEE